VYVCVGCGCVYVGEVCVRGERVVVFVVYVCVCVCVWKECE